MPSNSNGRSSVSPPSPTPLLRRAAGDPWMIRHDGWYYFTATLDPDGGLWVWKSRTLTGIDKGRKVKVWTAPPSGPQSRQIWAPELHRLRGRWYLYYTASDGEDRNHRHYVSKPTRTTRKENTRTGAVWTRTWITTPLMVPFWNCPVAACSGCTPRALCGSPR
jgi:GH43 family beta-xylosidase